MIEGIRFENNPLLYIDLTESTSKYDSPCIILIVGNTTITAVFRYGYGGGANALTDSSNRGTRSSVTTIDSTKFNPTITSFDIMVNGSLATRRRYGNPGISVGAAYNDAKLLLYDKIYRPLKELLDTNSSNKMSTVSTFPAAGNTADITNLIRQSLQNN